MILLVLCLPLLRKVVVELDWKWHRWFLTHHSIRHLIDLSRPLYSRTISAELLLMRCLGYHYSFQLRLPKSILWWTFHLCRLACKCKWKSLCQYNQQGLFSCSQYVHHPFQVSLHYHTFLPSTQHLSYRSFLYLFCLICSQICRFLWNYSPKFQI